MASVKTNGSGPTCQPPTLRDYADMEYILIGDLRDLLEHPQGEENDKWLLAILDELLDTLWHEFHLEEEGGYLAEALEQYPTWSAQVDALREQHDALQSKLSELRDRVIMQAPFVELADELRDEFAQWMNSLTAHHRHERRLLQTALTLEVGVGD